MNGYFKNKIVKRLIVAVLSIVMVLSLIPNSVLPALAATSAHPNFLTITVMDEDGEPLADAMVDYRIDSVDYGDNCKSGSLKTDSSGSVEIFESDYYEENQYSISATISKEGYKTNSDSISNKLITSGTEDIQAKLISTTIKGVSVAPLNAPYKTDNKGNAVSQEAVVVTGTKSGDVVTYSQDAVKFDKNVPKISKVGKYDITVKVERAGCEAYTETVTAEITKADITGITVKPLNMEYSGSAGKLVDISGYTNADTVTVKYDGKQYNYKEDKIPTFTNVGKYNFTVTISRNDNYNAFSESYTGEVTSVDIDGLSATLCDDTVYNGNDIDLVKGIQRKVGKKTIDVLNDSNYTVEYRVNSGDWTTKRPTEKDAGEYTIEIQVSIPNDENYNSPTKVTLNPATVTISKANQNLKFEGNHSETTITLDKENPRNNEYSFSAKGGNVEGAKIEYSVINTSDNNPVDDIATIDDNGLLTVKEAGHTIAVVATVKGDKNYNDTSIVYELTILNDDNQLIYFEKSDLNYVLNGNTNIISEQAAKKKYEKEDTGSITYAIDKNNIGIIIDKTSGKLTISNYSDLISALDAEEQKKITLTVTAEKRAGSVQKKKLKDFESFFEYMYYIVYGDTSADSNIYQESKTSYTVEISFAEDSGYKVNDDDLKDTWYTGDATVKPSEEGYLISKEINGNENMESSFEDQVSFTEDGDSSTSRLIYLKNPDGGITRPIPVPINIDKTAPDANSIEISWSNKKEEQNKKKEHYWFGAEGNDKVDITFKAKDVTSGVDYFTWSYFTENGASDALKDAKEYSEQKVNATYVEEGDDAGKYIATITLPKDEADQLRGFLKVTAVDKAGNSSAIKNDDGHILVRDTIAPDMTVSCEYEEGYYQEVGGHYYTSNPVKITVTVKEANFDTDCATFNVVNKVDNSAIDASLTWEKSDKVEDIWIGTYTLPNDDGDFQISINYKDQVGHKATIIPQMPNGDDGYKSPVITIDTKKPELTFAYSNANNSTASKDNPQTATITITEHNFRASDLEVKTNAVDINGKPVIINEKPFDTKDFEAILQDEGRWVHKEGTDVYTATISDDFADAIYQMTLNYKDLALNAADEVKSGEFIVDHTAPTDLEVNYSDPHYPGKEEKDSPIRFYNNKTNSEKSGLEYVTVTFSAKDITSGVKDFTWSYKKEETASNVNVSEYKESTLEAVQDKDDKSLFTASIDLPLEEAEQLRGNIAFSATDNYENESKKVTDSGTVIVVDSISPKMEVEYTDSSRTYGKKMYYNKNLTATFKVNEANFYATDVVVERSKNGGAFEKIKVDWDNQSTGDLHIGTYTIKASSDHSNDGDYIFRVTYTDRSGNEMSKYTSSNIFVIDTIKPVINVTYANKKPVNTLKDNEGKTRDYFKTTQTATVTINEHNFNAGDVDFSIVAKDVTGKTLNADKLSSKSSWSTNGDNHTIKITYPGDANYTFDIAYADLATNKANNYAEDYFTVDKTAPTNLSVSYSNSILDTVLQAITFGFYNAKMTVTITATDNISGVHRFLYSYLKAVGVSGVNAELVNQTIEESGITYSNGGATATAKFEIPRAALGNNNQFNGTVKFTATDRSENQSNEFGDTKRIVVDNIAPTSSVTYNAPVQTTGGVAYYDGNITATVTINEANFYPEDVKVSVTRDGAAYSVTPSWSNNSTDVHVGTFTLSDDGDYLITISYVDKSTNQMVTYTSEQLTVDTEIVEPVITVNGEDGNGKAFKDQVIPAVSFEDVNFESYTIKLTRTRYDEKDVDVTEEYIGNNVRTNDQGGSGTFDTFIKEPDVDGIYTLTISMTDKAGHSTESTITFTVNRFGSVYVYDDYLISLIQDGGAYIKAVEDDLIVTEYNADKLVEGSLDVQVSRDGKPLDDVDFVTTPEINDQVTVGSSGWYQYRYTIDKANFKSDGVYKMAISSKDATGNTPETTNYEDKNVLFRVDSTPPEINSIAGLEEEIIDEQSVEVKYNVYDTIGLASVQVYVDGKAIDTITDFSEDLNSYEGKFTLSENSAAQTVRLVVRDLAGNETDTDDESFEHEYAFEKAVTVSTNPFIRALAWVRSHVPAASGIIIGIAAVIFLIVFFFKKRKKDDDEEADLGE